MALASLRPAAYMSFLRPLALPRAATLNRFLSTSTPVQSTTEAASTTEATSSPTQSLEYRVSRTPSAQLPIYLLAKRGGNLKQTRVKKIEGNIAQLREDLKVALGIEEDREIQVNHLTRHIIVKGHRKPEVAKFLEEHNISQACARLPPQHASLTLVPRHYYSTSASVLDAVKQYRHSRRSPLYNSEEKGTAIVFIDFEDGIVDNNRASRQQHSRGEKTTAATTALNRRTGHQQKRFILEPVLQPNLRVRKSIVPSATACRPFARRAWGRLASNTTDLTMPHSYIIVSSDEEEDELEVVLRKTTSAKYQGVADIEGRMIKLGTVSQNIPTLAGRMAGFANVRARLLDSLKNLRKMMRIDEIGDDSDSEMVVRR
ncbi:hypothetical protein V500_10961 [Pseudogymnoascus sp. VKM F-4518 (FW-2643)]|nr:hypothetical protein V500_10961 [Pseudogymnoascus sp. VKM F-4518 (FW-2643)]